MRCILWACATTWISVAAWAQDGTIITANRNGGSVSLFDVNLGAEMARIPLYNIPHEVVTSPDGRYAITGEYGLEARHGSMVIVIDIAKAIIAGKIDLGSNSRPHSFAFLPDGRRAVVTMQEDDALALIDITDMHVVKAYATGGKGSHMVRISPDGARAYVANRDSDNTSVIFLDRDQSPVLIKTGKGSEGIAVSPDGSTLWVAGRTDKTLTIIDTQRLTVVHTLQEDYAAGRIEIMPDGRVVAPEGAPGHTLHIYDGQTYKKMGQQQLYADANEGGGQYGLVAYSAGMYVTDVQRGRILHIAQIGETPPTVVATGREAPDGIAFSPVRLDTAVQRP